MSKHTQELSGTLFVFDLNPKKTNQKRQKRSEYNEFQTLRVGQKEQGRCRSIGRDREDSRHMTMGNIQRKFYLFGPKPRARKKDTKLMLLRRLRGVKKGRAVTIGMMCRDVWGMWEHLLDVSRHFGTFWNPQKMGPSPATRKKETKKVQLG
jgi:hypothetical protein